jgi:hypothetical protein
MPNFLENVRASWRPRAALSGRRTSYNVDRTPTRDAADIIMADCTEHLRVVSPLCRQGVEEAVGRELLVVFVSVPLP